MIRWNSVEALMLKNRIKVPQAVVGDCLQNQCWLSLYTIKLVSVLLKLTNQTPHST